VEEIHSRGAKFFHNYWIWRRSACVNPLKSFRFHEFSDFCVFIVKEVNSTKSHSPNLI
jgi:hypothetical protein